MWLALGLSFVAALSACTPTERVVATRGGLGLVAGQDGTMRAAPSAGGGRTWEMMLLEAYGPPPGEPIEGQSLRHRLEDGSTHLVSRAPAHLVLHLIQTLQQQEHDLLFEQLISEHTKSLLEDRGRDPREAIDYLVENEADVREALLALRGGADAPGIRLRSFGGNRYRLESSGRSGSARRFGSLDIRIEKGRFVLDDIN